MKLLRGFCFVVLGLLLSYPIFHFFQAFPEHFPFFELAPPIWSQLKSCCGGVSYEEKQDIQFLATVSLSLIFSFLGALLIFKLIAVFKKLK